MSPKNVIILVCGVRTTHFGQGSYMNVMLPFLKQQKSVSLTLIRTDCPDRTNIIKYTEEDVDVIEIPSIQQGTMITGHSHPIQTRYSMRIVAEIYPFLRHLDNLLILVNSIDYLNIVKNLRSAISFCKILYVHHSFSWKYLINVPDSVFKAYWKAKNDAFHPQAFEMTRYQQEMASISDYVVTVTHHAKEFFVNVLDINPNKFFTIYNGGSLPNRKRKTNLRKRYGFSDLDKIIIFSGRITKDKGFPFLIRAFKSLADENNNCRLVVLGYGMPLEYLPDANPHWSKIIFTGNLNNKQIAEFYQLSDVGVIPSLHEQCSFTAIEMRLNRLPILTAAVDGLDEMFLHNYDCLKLDNVLDGSGIRTLDVNDFSDKLRLLLYDKTLAKKVMSNSYKVGISKFTVDIMWKNYENLFDKIFQS